MTTRWRSGWPPIRGSPFSASSARHASGGTCTASWHPARAALWSTAGPLRRLSTAVRTSTRSLSQWSRAATITPVRCASRPSAFRARGHSGGVRGAFRQAGRALCVRDPLSLETEVGPLIHPREADRVQSWIEEAAAGGGRIVVGGERLSATTLRPAILVQPPANSKVSREEVFGRSTCIYGFTKLDEAIEAANSLSVAFQASIFTREIGTALRAAERLDASAVIVNDHTAFRTDWMPFAGRRHSGRPENRLCLGHFPEGS